MPRRDRPPLRLGPLWVAAAAVAVSAGVVGISGALDQSQAGCGASCPPALASALPAGQSGEVARAVAGSDGEVLQPLPSAVDAAASEPAAVTQAPTVAALPPRVDPQAVSSGATTAARRAPAPPTTAARPTTPSTATPRPTTARPTTPRPTTPATTTRQAGPPAQPGPSAWDRIAACESGGNWAAPQTSDGYSGGLMFSASAWAQYGGTAYAPIAGQATKAQQIVVAERVHQLAGDYSAWPGCGDGL